MIQHLEVKKCTKCGETKILSCFGNTKSHKDGLSYYCRDCNKELCKTRSRSKRGILSQSYSGQIRSSKTRGHNPPEYSKEDFLEWGLSQDIFHELHSQWVASDFDGCKTPSIDRLDDYRGYSFDNIQILTWDENRAKGHLDKVNGKNNKRSKAVVKLDRNGNFISEYYSAHQASRETGIHRPDISNVCNGKPIKCGCNVDGTVKYYTPKTAGGFIWKYKSEYSNQRLTL